MKNLNKVLKALNDALQRDPEAVQALFSVKTRFTANSPKCTMWGSMETKSHRQAALRENRLTFPS